MSISQDGGLLGIGMGVMQIKEAIPSLPCFGTDLALTEAAAAGDLDARRQLADRLFDRVRTTVSYIAAGAEAEDIAQSAVIQILRKADSFRGDSSLEAWADRVAVRCVLKSFEKRSRRQRLFEANWPPPAEPVSLEERIEQRQARQHLSQLLQKLSSHHAIVLVLRYLHGYKVEEIADILGARVNTIRGRLRAGRAKLKEQILTDPVLSEWLERSGL